MRIGPSKLASVGPMLTIFPAVCTVDVVYGQTFLSTELRSVYREHRSLSFVANHTIVTDCAIRHPGFDLLPHARYLLNRFRTAVCKWSQPQTLKHSVDTCPLTTSKGGVQSLRETEDNARNCLETTVPAAVTQWSGLKPLLSILTHLKHYSVC